MFIIRVTQINTQCKRETTGGGEILDLCSHRSERVTFSDEIIRFALIHIKTRHTCHVSSVSHIVCVFINYVIIYSDRQAGI